MADAERLRAQAERCRRLADLTHDPWTEAELLRLAEEYEADARRSAGESGSKPVPPNPLPG